jgi:hypothetical protein
MIEETTTIQEVDPKIKIVHKTEEFMDNPFDIDIFVMSGCLWVWIGNQSPQFSNLSSSMITKFVKIKQINKKSSVPLSTNIFGPQNDTLVNGLAQKLALKTKMVVYVSYNLEKSKEYQIYVEKKLLQNILEWIQ